MRSPIQTRRIGQTNGSVFLRAVIAAAVAFSAAACGEEVTETVTIQNVHEIDRNPDSFSAAATFGGGAGNTLGVNAFDIYPISVDAGGAVTLTTSGISDPVPASVTCEVAMTIFQTFTLKADGSITGSGQAFLTQLKLGDRFGAYTLTKNPTSNNAFPTASFTPAVGGDTPISNPFVYRPCPAGYMPTGGDWTGFAPLADTTYYMHYYGTGGRVLVTRVVKVGTPSWANRCSGSGCAYGGVTRGNTAVYDTVLGAILGFGGDATTGSDGRGYARRWQPGSNNFAALTGIPNNGDEQGRGFVTAVYDRAGAKTVLHSGIYDYRTWSCGLWGTCNIQADDSNRTFEYNSSANSWENNSNGGMDTRNKYAAVYADNAGWSNRVLVHSGIDARGGLRADDLRHYNSSTNAWSTVGASSGPGQRWGHAMAWDSDRSRVILFGGCTAATGDNGGSNASFAASGTCADGSRRNDVWEWNNSTWTQRTTSGGPPSARYNHQIAYDPLRRRLVLYGGCTNNSANPCTAAGASDQVWELDLAPATAVWYGPYTGTGVARYLHGMAFHPIRGSVFVINGSSGDSTNLERVDERTTPNNDQLLSYNVSRTWIAAGTSSQINVNFTTRQGLTSCTVFSEGSGYSAVVSNGGLFNLDANGGGYDLRGRQNNNLLIDCGGGVRGDINVRREVEIRTFTATPNIVDPAPQNVTFTWEIRAASQCRLYDVDLSPVIPIKTVDYTGTTNAVQSHVVNTYTPPDEGGQFQLQCDGYSNVTGGTTTKTLNRAVTLPPANYGGGSGNTTGIDVFEVTPVSVWPRTGTGANDGAVTFTLKVKEPVGYAGTSTCVVAFNMPGTWAIAAGGAMTGTGTKFQSGGLAAGDSVNGRTISSVTNDTTATATAGADVPAGSSGLVYRNCPGAVQTAMVTPSGTTWGPFYPQSNPTDYYMHVQGVGGQVLVKRSVSVHSPSLTNRCDGSGCSYGGATRGNSIVYDYSAGLILGFGGDINTGYNARNWARAWNVGSNNWSARTAIPTIGSGDDRDEGRAYFTAVYDRANARTIINSGVDDARHWSCGFLGLSTCDHQADDRVTTFEYNYSGNSWQTLSVSSNSTVNKYGATYADNNSWAADRRVLVFSGSDLRGSANRSADLRGYNASSDSWTGAITGSSNPSARWGHAMAWDSTRNRVVLYGGCTATTGDNNGSRESIRASGRCASRQSDVWEWDNSNWTSRSTTVASGSTAPAARFNHNMAYDPARRRIVVYGGCEADNADQCTSPSGNIWELDLAPATAVWYGPVATGVPRELFGMAYNPSRNSIFAVNGSAGGTTNRERVDEIMTTVYDRITKLSATRTWIPAGVAGTSDISWTTQDGGAVTPCTLNNYVDAGASFANGGTYSMDSTSPERRTRTSSYIEITCPSGVRADLTIRREVEIKSFTASPVVLAGASGAVTLNWDIRATSQCRVYRVDNPGPSESEVLLNTTNYNNTSLPTSSYALGTISPPAEGILYRLKCDGYTNPATWGTTVAERRVGRQGTVSLSASVSYGGPGEFVPVNWSSSAWVVPGSCELGGVANNWIWFDYNTNAADGDAIVFTDYQSTPYRMAFEFDSNSTFTFPPPPGIDEVVPVTIGANATATRDNLVAAINASSPTLRAAASTSLGLTDYGAPRLVVWTLDSGANTNNTTIFIQSATGFLSSNSFTGGLNGTSTTCAGSPTCSGSGDFLLGTTPTGIAYSCQGFDASGNYTRLTSIVPIWRKVEPFFFNADPTAVVPGDNTVTVDWQVAGFIPGASCSLTGPGDNGVPFSGVQAYPTASLGTPPAAPPFTPPVDFVNVDPVPEPKFYRLACVGDGVGNSFVTTTPPSLYQDVLIYRKAEIQLFAASETAAYVGQTLNFAWTTVNVSPGSCSINNGVGAVPDQATLGGGEYPIQITAPPATYVLSCNGDGTPWALAHGGLVTANLTIERHVEVTAFTTDPVAVLPGFGSTLSWTTVNATDCSIDNGIGSVSVPSGAVSTGPIASPPRTYTITCNGTGGSDIKNVTVQKAASISSFTATPDAVHPGANTTLAWSSADTASCAINNGVGSVPLSSAGYVVAVANPTTVYTLTCAGNYGDPASANVTVNRRVEVLSFSATPNVVVPNYGTTFSFTTAAATDCRIYRPPYAIPGDEIYNVSAQLPAGVQAHTYPGPGSIAYRMRCTGVGSPHTLDTTVSPPTVVTIAAFSSNLGAVLPNGTVQFTWVSYSPTDTHTCALKDWTGTTFSTLKNGTSVVSPAIPAGAFPATFTLECIRGADPMASAQITIQRKVNIDSFTALPTPLAPGQPAVLSWSVTQATDCDIDGDAGFGPVPVPSGTLNINGVGTSPLPRTYVMTCRGPGGPVTANATINPPVVVTITGFTSAQATVLSGQPVNLTWGSYLASSCTVTSSQTTPATNLSGTSGTGVATQNITTFPATFTLSCAGPGGPATSQVVIYEKGWVQVTSGLSGASGRELAASVYDSGRSRAIVFGGYRNGFLNDLWEWDGTSWTERTPVTKPEARYAHAMAYDAANSRTVLFGGYSDDYGYLSGTWVWNGTAGTWTLAENGSGAAWCDDPYNAGATSPAPRTGAGMAYDTVLQRVLLFGGRCGEYFFDDMWAWNGSTNTWSRLCTACVSGTSKPQARTDFVMAYDAARARTVIYGGIGLDASDNLVYYPNTPAPASEPQGYTWTYNSATNTWAAATPADPDGDGNPAPRRWAGAAYDTVRQRVVIFGGQSSDGVTKLNDTWGWYNNGGMTWRRLLGTFPELSPRMSHQVLWDGGAGRQDMLLLSGVGESSPDPLGDFWKWDLP